MRVRHFAAAAALSFGAAAARAQAASLSTTGAPTLQVTTALAGSPPTTVSVATTTLTFNTGNGSGKTLQAKLSAALPSGVTLDVSVSAPTGASSLGFVTLTTANLDLTTLIPKSTNGTLTITHRLSATSAAGVLAASTASVVFRLN